MEGRLVELIRPRLHDGQRKVWKARKRYNALRCGRRWGKSTLAEYALKHSTTVAHPSAYFAPTYRDLQPMWDKMKSDLIPITLDRSEAQHYIKLIGGAQLDFWSLEDPDSSRGRTYYRVIIDETAKVKKLEYAWTQTIRPTLIDLHGEAWFATTGRGIGSYFNRLFVESVGKEEWQTYTAPTIENPHIDPKEIEEAERTMHPLAYQQEIMGDDVSWSEHQWCYAFEDRHIATGDDDCPFNPNRTVYLSFDFNVDPLCASAHQLSKDRDGEYYYTLFEWRIENSDTSELCRRIMASEVGGCHFLVTGDATGRRRDTRSNLNDWIIVKKELKLVDSQLKVGRSNPGVSDSRTLTNSIFARHPDRKIHPRCKYIIADLRFVQAKGDDIDKSDGRLSHFLDNIRYADNTFFGDFVKRM